MPPGMNIPININTAQLKKSFKEVGKLQAKAWQTRKRQLRIEERASKEETKNLKKEWTEKRKMMDHETKHHKKLRDERGKYIKREETFTRKQEQSNDRGFRKARDRMRDMGKEAKKQGFLRKGLGKLGGAAAFAGGGLLGMLIGYSLKAYQNYMATEMALSPLIGQGGGKAMGRAAKVSQGGGGNLGFDIRQRAGMAAATARATGATGAGAVPMMEAMRATGMGQGEVGQIFSTLRQGGAGFEGRDSKGKREFKEIIAAGLQSGVERARLPEFFQGVTSLMQTQQAMMAGDVGSGGISKLAAALGNYGKQHGLSGFQGARGMALMGKLQQGILQPGGGGAGMAFMRQAFGFGAPEGGTSFYSAEKAREKGFGNNAEGFKKVMGELTRQYGTGEDAVLKMREVFGTSISQGEELIKMFKSGDLDIASMDKIQKIMEDAEPLEVQAAKAMKEAATALRKIAGRFDSTVGHGAQAAKIIDKMEEMQRKLMEMLFKAIPKIVAALDGLWGIMKDIWAWLKQKFNIGAEAYKGIKDVLGFGGPGAGEKLAGAKQGIEVLQQRILAEKDPKKRQLLLRAMQRRSSQAGLGASHDTDLFGGDERHRARVEAEAMRYWGQSANYLARASGYSDISQIPAEDREWYSKKAYQISIAAQNKKTQAYDVRDAQEWAKKEIARKNAIRNNPALVAKANRPGGMQEAMETGTEFGSAMVEERKKVEHVWEHPPRPADQAPSMTPIPTTKSKKRK